MKMKLLKTIQYLFIIMVFVISYHSTVLAVTKAPDILAVSSIIVETGRGQVLYEKEPKAKLHISSANKIMTALLALEKARGQLDTLVTISKNAASVEGSILNLEIGGKYSVQDLVYTVILTSANDSANALAEYVGGSTEAFVELMNSKAQELKMKDTHFTNPTGLYDEAQYTTSYDIALLIRYALGNSDFDDIFSSKAWYLQWGTSNIIVNSNELFWRYDGVDGGKTGYNEPGKNTAITTVTRNGQRLICVVLDSPQQYEDSAKLFDYAFDNYRSGILVSKGQPLKTVMVGDKSVDLVSISDYYYTYPVGENYIKDIVYSDFGKLSPPLTTEDEVGTAKYILKDGTEIDIKLYPDTDVYSSVSFVSVLASKMVEYKELTLLLIILVFIEVTLLIYSLVKIIRNAVCKLIHNIKD